LEKMYIAFYLKQKIIALNSQIKFWSNKCSIR
jgi:hypothetical protein